jgi:hypothetical protein
MYILRQCFKPSNAALLTVVFLHLFGATELDEGLAAGCFGRHTSADIFVDVELEMGFEFVREFAVAALLIE